MTKIDFVLTWVDGSDPEWIKKKNKYMKINNIYDDNKMVDEKAFRDWNILKYWFRSVEKYADWVNQIHFVTEGHIPEWLNIEHPKINIVKHSDFLPESALPTFNSRAIELNFNKIENISDKFVYFNDDMFINKKVDKEDFFINNIPVDSGILSPVYPERNGTSAIQINNLEIINSYFTLESSIYKNITKWINFLYGKYNLKTLIGLLYPNIIGIQEQHLPTPLLKKTLDDLWIIEKKTLNETTNSKFKTKENVNQWLFRDWQLVTGCFFPRSIKFGKYYNIKDDFKEIIEEIEKSKYKIICVNDSYGIEKLNIMKMQQQLQSVFENKYPAKSTYEL